MAQFKILLDKRNIPNRNNEYNLVIRICHKSEVHYMRITKMTEPQYHKIFEKKSTDEDCIAFRKTCNSYITRCETIFNNLRPFNYAVFKEKFFKKDDEITASLLIKDLFDRFLETRTDLKHRTKLHYRMTRNVLETYHPGLKVADITVDFIKKFEKFKLDNGCTRSTVDTLNRNIRAVLRYFKYNEPIIPESYDIPFGNGKISISSYFPSKMVLTNEEIEKIANLKEFNSKQEEYARDIWLFLYRCNGINLADAIRLRWDDIKGDKCIFFTRRKTETTRKNNKKQIVVPITPKLKELIDKVGVKSSSFILGRLQDGFSESMYENKLVKVRKQINPNLRKIQTTLGLSATLNIKTAREAYACTLKRANFSKDIIGEMLGHSNSTVTEHYLSPMDIEKTFNINDVLY